MTWRIHTVVDGLDTRGSTETVAQKFQQGLPQRETRVTREDTTGAHSGSLEGSPQVFWPDPPAGPKGLLVNHIPCPSYQQDTRETKGSYHTSKGYHLL